MSKARLQFAALYSIVIERISTGDIATNVAMVMTLIRDFWSLQDTTRRPPVSFFAFMRNHLKNRALSNERWEFAQNWISQVFPSPASKGDADQGQPQLLTDDRGEGQDQEFGARIRAWLGMHWSEHVIPFYQRSILEEDIAYMAEVGKEILDGSSFTSLFDLNLVVDHPIVLQDHHVVQDDPVNMVGQPPASSKSDPEERQASSTWPQYFVQLLVMSEDDCSSAKWVPSGAYIEQISESSVTFGAIQLAAPARFEQADGLQCVCLVMPKHTYAYLVSGGLNGTSFRFSLNGRMFIWWNANEAFQIARQSSDSASSPACSSVPLVEARNDVPGRDACSTEQANRAIFNATTSPSQWGSHYEEVGDEDPNDSVYDFFDPDSFSELSVECAGPDGEASGSYERVRWSRAESNEDDLSEFLLLATGESNRGQNGALNEPQTETTNLCDPLDQLDLADARTEAQRCTYSQQMLDFLDVHEELRWLCGTPPENSETQLP